MWHDTRRRADGESVHGSVGQPTDPGIPKSFRNHHSRNRRALRKSLLPLLILELSRTDRKKMVYNGRESIRRHEEAGKTKAPFRKNYYIHTTCTGFVQLKYSAKGRGVETPYTYLAPPAQQPLAAGEKTAPRHRMFHLWCPGTRPSPD
jgi:hypothetical protein